jgi:tRNA(His) 5'-end guanylyltransferase
MNDELGKRMKDFYENRTKTLLPRRTYTIIRIDGKSFHTYTKGLIKPFDIGLVNDMNNTAIYLCKEIQGALFAYVQSDEISILLTDFKNLNTEAWFNGEVQKIVSVSSSLATAKFNQIRMLRESLKEKYFNPDFNDTTDYILQWNDIRDFKLAIFDSRVFTIPNIIEVGNYFVWRQKDCIRNSISLYGNSIFSHNELKNKSGKEVLTMCEKLGFHWNELNDSLKNGRLIIKNDNKWEATPAKVFTKDDYLFDHIIEPYKN